MADKASVKADLRRQALARRRAIAPEARAEQSRQVVAHVVASVAWAEARHVLLYRSVGSEVATARLFDAAWADGKTVGVPVTAPTGLRAVVVVPATSWRPGPHGIPEPTEAEAWDDGWDLVVVPGVAFDRAGHRLGYGKGYYDRFLAQRRHGSSLGLAYRESVVEQIPRQAHDLPVDVVMTPDGPLY